MKVLLLSFYPISFIFGQPVFSTVELDTIHGYNSLDYESSGNYIVFGNNNAGASIQMIDGTGNILQAYNLPNLNLRCGKQTTDQGFILGGDSSGTACIVRLDVNGNKLWKTDFNSHLAGFVSAVGLNYTGGFYACVNNDSALYQNPDYFALIDSLGSLTKLTALVANGGIFSDNSVIETNDSSWIVLSSESYVEHTRIFKIDALGNVQWNKFYSDTTPNEAIGFSSWGISSIANDTFIVSGIVEGNSNGHDFGLLYAIDPNGDTLWSKTYQSVNNLRSLRLIQARKVNNGDYYVVGNQFDFSSQAIILLMRLNSNGDTLWTKQFPGRGMSSANSMILDLNGDPMILGVTRDTLLSLSFSYLIYASSPTTSEKDQLPFGEKISIVGDLNNYRVISDNSITIEIIDISGQVVSVQHPHNGSIINTASLSKGVYVLSLTDTKGNRLKKKILVY